jgi:CRP-like cAMP-binding protein
MATFRTALNAVRRSYRRLVNRRADARTREIVDTLQQVAAFTICSKGTLYEVAESMHRRTYSRGEHLYYQGDPGLGLFIVEQGKIQLTAEGEQGATYDLRELGPYEVCGTISILGDFPRLETARATTEAQVLGFFRPDLNNLTKRNPAAGTEIITVLAQHVAAQHVQMVRLMEECVGVSTAMNTYAQASEAVVQQQTPR